MIRTARSGARSASRKRSKLTFNSKTHSPTNQRTLVMKKLLFALLPGIISRVLKARKAKQLRAAQTRPPRNRY